MFRKTIALLVFACVLGTAAACSGQGIMLSPGETLLAVDGVPVRSVRVFTGPVPRIQRVAAAPFQLWGNAVQQFSENRTQAIVVRQCRRDARGNWSCNQ